MKLCKTSTVIHYWSFLWEAKDDQLWFYDWHCARVRASSNELKLLIVEMFSEIQNISKRSDDTDEVRSHESSLWRDSKKYASRDWDDVWDPRDVTVESVSRSQWHSRINGRMSILQRWNACAQDSSGHKISWIRDLWQVFICSIWKKKKLARRLIFGMSKIILLVGTRERRLIQRFFVMISLAFGREVYRQYGQEKNLQVRDVS